MLILCKWLIGAFPAASKMLKIKPNQKSVILCLFTLIRANVFLRSF